jgi:hypothetical protein
MCRRLAGRLQHTRAADNGEGARCASSAALAATCRQGAREGGGGVLAGRSMHAHMTARSEARAGSVARHTGRRRAPSWRKVVKEREEQCHVEEAI